MSDFASRISEIGSRWIEIDLDAVAHNTRQVKKFLSPDTALMAVVKADAYGLGILEISRTVLECGAESLGVTTLEEALRLRKNGIEAPILMLAPLLPEEYASAVAYQIMPTISSVYHLDFLAREARLQEKTVSVHLELETGMGRTGLSPEEALHLCRKLRDYPEILVRGIYTHFAAAGENQNYTRKQYQKYIQVLDKLGQEELRPGQRHVCNSAAVLKYPEMHLDMVRVGTLLYGQLPPGLKSAAFDLRDPWRAKARILDFKTFRAGASIGYGRDERLRKEALVALMAIGYADGFYVAPVPRLTNWKLFCKSIAKIVLDFLRLRPAVGQIKLKNRQAEIVGRVGMQLTALNVSSFAEVDLGEEVELPVRRVNANPVLPRVYFKAGRIWSIRTVQFQEHRKREGDPLGIFKNSS